MAYILYFIITVGVLVLVHEFGHFIAAKIFGMKVDTFSIGFPPRAFGKKIGETDYCVSWIPIGGYVKIAGMVDESFDTDFLDKPPQPNEFRSKPMYQRIIVVSAGVIMNFLLTFLIFYGINLANGKLFHATTTVGFVEPNSVAEKIGFRQGDQLLSVNDKALKNWEEVQTDFYLEDAATALSVKVNRDGNILNLNVPKGFVKPDEQIGIYPNHMHAVIGAVDPLMPASKAGIKPGDIIAAIGGQQITTNTQVVDLVKKNKGKPVQLEIKRGAELKNFTVTPNSDGKIGIEIGTQYTGPIQKFSYNVLTAVPAGFDQTVGATVLLVQSLVRIATGQVSFTKSVGGPIKIAQLATQSAEMGIVSFLGFMALLSISLAVLNILPIPALDGGHLAFLVYESIFRREVPTKIKLYAQQVGFALLLLFMAFVIYNDIAHF
ncbi:MAG: RIP metalloprotease RseP [Bacteroidetes bacterium]|nr:RIP metalloprotease RseP [Bacteroidota bacterium]MCL5737798.1 RIP metalloprotease RseP [Bacteroidota bacterium]